MGSCYSSSRGVAVGREASGGGAVNRGSSSSGRWKKIGSIGKMKFGSSAYCEGGLNQYGNQSQIHVAGKMCSNGASDFACLYTQQGKKGTNQDAMLVWEVSCGPTLSNNYSSRDDTVFCGVFDGHGPLGHMVAKRVRDSLPIILSTQWNSYTCEDQTSLPKIENGPTSMVAPEGAPPVALDDQWVDSSAVQENEKEKLPEIYLPLKQSMLKAFNLMDKELKLHPTIDCFCSGTTAVTLVKQGQNLMLGNVGDSRAVLATRDKDNSLVAVQLTVDLKPDLPREAARIQQCKGRVFALQDEPEVARVWLPNNDSPGLAMARAFGDFCLKDFGLISVPDIFYRRLTERDEFIILATDGVWDVLSNKEAVDIVASAPGRATAARALVDCAVRAWRLKYPSSKNDDCAVVCLFLDQKPSNLYPGTVDEPCAAPPPEGTVEKTTAPTLEKVPQGPDTYDDDGPDHNPVLERLGTLGSNEIVPVSELTEEEEEEKSVNARVGQSKRSLAECIASSEDDEWSALEGVTRVNSLLSLPRFLSGDARSTSWRKWL
ncbi:probable protein phosphatase 2C 6 isoform X2 [Punica granatum]|uniref:protein-serine/threonine phosphatase n=1 Tax=Punica granatum TaxID=22663 RepID=A0A6P8EGK7_PUNGR|nr:probable protein phosphatase 2C 6 isoform X2 [Punica granatum]